jgi:hypothetical protein
MKAFAFLAALALAACLAANDGGGSDTEALTGIVTDDMGMAAAGARVKLLPSDYDPSQPAAGAIRTVVTDAEGRFRFEAVDTGRTWNVIAGGGASGGSSRSSWAFARGLKPGGAARPLALSLAKVFRFKLHSADYSDTDSGIAYFPGTDILARCEGATATIVDSVPPGALRFVVESRAGWKHDTTLTSVSDSVAVLASKDGITATQ